MQAILKILEAFYQHEFIKLLFHAAPSFVLGVLTTVYLWLDTNSRGFISRSVEYLLHLTPKPRALGNRDKANPIIQRIIRTAAADRSWVYFMGIAHIDICDDGAPLHVLFDEALGSGIAEARFVFLDPASPNCARREFHESDRDVEPAHKIRHSIEYLTRVRKTYPLVKFITSPEVPFYACFNQSEIVLHPYLNSKVGRETTCFWGPANGDLYKATKKHFERLWGSSRWVLLDLGNVLIDFDHRNVGRRIREVVGTGRPDVDETFIHKFIFEDSSGPGTSLNSQLDRGALTLEELRAKINSEFRMSIDSRQMQEAWNSIFSSQLNSETVTFATELVNRGVKVGICSSTNSDHWNHVLRSHSSKLRSFSGVGQEFLTHEFRVAKTDPRFFQKVAARTECPLEHHLLLDDKPENCRSAEAAGLSAFWLNPSNRATAFQDVNEFINQNWGPLVRAAGTGHR